MGILTLSALLNILKIPVNGYRICKWLVKSENSYDYETIISWKDEVMKKLFFILLLTVILSVCSNAAIYIVDPNGFADFSDIQSAINSASDHDTIIVNPGIYTGPNNRDIEFHGLDITVRSTDPNDLNVVEATIIDCNGSEFEPHRGFSFNNNEDGNSILNGLTITNGYASFGGGILTDGTSPKILNCIIYGNSASNYGGGIVCRWKTGESPYIYNCKIYENTAIDGDGGGIYSYDSYTTIKNCKIFSNSVGGYGKGGGIGSLGRPITVIECEITNNDAYEGGGIHGKQGLYGTTTISDCRIYSNTAWNFGGGISFNEDGYASITNCIIEDNYCWNFSGGIHCAGDPTTIQNCIIRNNECESRGGGITIWKGNAKVENSLIYGNSGSGIYIASNAGHPVIENSIIYGNIAYNGAGIVSDFTAATITNCTLTNNSATNLGGAIHCRYSDFIVTNCIVWDNDAPEGPEISVEGNSASATVSYCNVQGGQQNVYLSESGCTLNWDTSNIDIDPLFVNADGDDDTLGTEDDNLRLQVGSLCVDAGDNAAVTEATDLDGGPRIVDGDSDGTATVDMGAYELMHVEETLDLGESATLVPNGGSGTATEDAHIVFENVSGGSGATVTVTQYDTDLHAAQQAYNFMGMTLVVDTSLSDGQFLTTITVPFTAADLDGLNWRLLNLQYWNGTSWELAASGNTLNSPGHVQREGDRFEVEDTAIPTLSNDLGDYGVFWNQTTGQGFVWANVDHTTDFTAGLLLGFDPDGDVDLADFAILAATWLSNDTPTANWNAKCDLDGSGDIGAGDLFKFSENWLFRKDKISDHVSEIEVEMFIDYENPTDASDTHYEFEFTVLTDTTVDRIECSTPGGELIEVTSTWSYVDTADGWIETGLDMEEIPGMYYWFLKSSFDNIAALDAYGDGTYNFTIHYLNGTSHQTSVWFGETGTSNPIAQPTQELILTSFCHGDVLNSPVNFTWQPCTDPVAKEIWFEIYNYDTNEDMEYVFTTDVTSFTEPLVMNNGSCEAEIGLDKWYYNKNSDGIDVWVSKYTESDYYFSVIDQISDQEN